MTMWKALIDTANYEYYSKRNPIQGEVRCRCETKNGGLIENGLLCETNGTTNKIGSCNSNEWCIDTLRDVYSTRLSPICQPGKRLP